MRIAIVGSGGVGGLLGALLARGGNDVALVARGAHLQALREHGLRVEGAVGSFTIDKIAAAESPAQIEPAGAVLVAVKAWQVAEVAPSLAPLLAAGGFVVPLQNGVEARDRLAAALGKERVVGGLCHLLAWTERPGLIKQSGPVPSVTVGEWSGGGSERLARLCEALTGAGITAQIAPSIQAALWEKALFVEALGAVGAVLRLPVGRFRSVPESRALLEGAMRETAAVARALGLEVGQPAVERALARVDSLPPEGTASMQRDLVAGRPSELDDQTGAIVRAADARGVPVPLHRFLLAALLPHERFARGV